MTSVNVNGVPVDISELKTDKKRRAFLDDPFRWQAVIDSKFGFWKYEMMEITGHFTLFKCSTRHRTNLVLRKRMNLPEVSERFEKYALVNWGNEYNAYDETLPITAALEKLKKLYEELKAKESEA